MQLGHKRWMQQLLSTAMMKPHRKQLPFNMDAIARAFDTRVSGYMNAHEVINYIESHDEPRLQTLLGENQNLDEVARFRRAKLAAALLLTAPGIPMLWMTGM